jgi:DnaJ-domain-containing protein 1
VVELLIEAINALEVEADAAQTQRSWTQQPPRQQSPQDRAQETAQDRERTQDPWGPGRRRAPSNNASPGTSQRAASGPAAGAARSGASRSGGNRRTTGAGQERPGTRSSGAGPTGADPTGAGPTGAGPTGASAAGQPPSGSGGDRRQLAALETLGLAWGASRASIKAAHRRLVKQHHPDMGGDAESFRLVNDAYQLLIA